MTWIEKHQPQILLGLLIGAAVLACVSVFLFSALQSVSGSLRRMLTGRSGADLEELICQALEHSRSARQEVASLDAEVKRLAQIQKTCVQKVGLVRYDAFNDVSGQQSFSLAMLDADNNGTVVTALLGRNDSRLYGKSIAAGQPVHALSDEERQALGQALKQRG